MSRLRRYVSTAAALAVLALPATGMAQENGSIEAALVGGALGAYSGAGLGLVGGLVPCGRTLVPHRCARVVTAVGAAVGSVAGAVVGRRDSDSVKDHLRGAGQGALAGAVVGVALRRFVRQYGWADVGASAALGAAVGASAPGAGVGFVVGVTSGVLFWKGFGVIGLSDAVVLSLGGMTVGGLIGWALATDSAPETRRAGFSIPLSVRF